MSCRNKPPSVIKNFKRILVIGDLHADYEMTIELLKKFKVIDNNRRWIAKDTFIVQMGDQVDGKGRNNADVEGEQEVLELFDDLNTQAEVYGGAVFSLIGNHELMNVMGDFRYASQADIYKDGGETLRKQKYTPGGILASRLACSRNALIKIDDIIFVHGGIAKEFMEDIKENKNIEFINTTLTEFLLNKIDAENEHVRKYFINKNGLFWDRSLGNAEVNCDDISYLKYGSIIVGHTPQTKINSKCNNKIWRTDVGLSKALGGNNHQLLEITKERNGKHKYIIME
jgi:hypothetical protein